MSGCSDSGRALASARAECEGRAVRVEVDHIHGRPAIVVYGQRLMLTPEAAGHLGAALALLSATPDALDAVEVDLP